jgi:hypothetical protein
MKNWLRGKIAESFVGKVVKDPDLQTTVLGFIGAAMIAKRVDWNAAFGGNEDAIATVVLAVVVGIWGWRTNKKKGVKP